MNDHKPLRAATGDRQVGEVLADCPDTLLLACVDLDGTLVDPLVGVLSERDARGLKAWVDQSRDLAIISARSPFAMLLVLDQLQTPCIASAFNGALIWRSTPDSPKNWIETPLFEVGLPFAPSLRLWNRCLELDAPVVWHGKNSSIATARSDVISFVAEGEPVVYSDKVDPADPAFKITVVGRTKQSDLIRDELRSEAAFTVHVTESGHVEVTNSRTNKGAALTMVCEAVHVPEHQVIAIGDGDNDVSMFERAAVSIAVQGASESARKAATVVLPEDSPTSVGSILLDILRS